MAIGKVVRFDGVRGFGFIKPELGGEDVFLHANDLLIPETSVRSGTSVEFEIEEGDRGPKASSVRLAERAQTPMTPPPAMQLHAPPFLRTSTATLEGGEEPTCDVLSVAEYSFEVTELLLNSASWLTGEQITQLRPQLIELSRSHGWVED